MEIHLRGTRTEVDAAIAAVRALPGARVHEERYDPRPGEVRAYLSLSIPAPAPEPTPAPTVRYPSTRDELCEYAADLANSRRGTVPAPTHLLLNVVELTAHIVTAGRPALYRRGEQVTMQMDGRPITAADVRACVDQWAAHRP